MGCNRVARISGGGSDAHDAPRALQQYAAQDPPLAERGAGGIGLGGWGKASSALKATLHALRDRLMVDEVAHLGAQLPLLIRGMYYEGWNPAGKPVKERRKAAFLTEVQASFRAGKLDTEPIVRGVFTVLAKHVTAGEIAAVTQMLAPELLDLWP
ncbi:MAG TPA: DUF2267 domain-containing protein [Candidatus Tectomicrobia bacterium]